MRTSKREQAAEKLRLVNKLSDAQGEKLKPPSVEPIIMEDEPVLFNTLVSLIEKYHENDNLRQARFVLAWQFGWHANVDGQVDLARTRRASELDQRLAQYDFVILLNRELWHVLSQAEVDAALDHELCHCAPRLDKEGNQVMDSTGRLEWRLRDHTIKEFPEIIERHGLYTDELRATAAAVARAPLFAGAGIGPTARTTKKKA